MYKQLRSLARNVFCIQAGYAYYVTMALYLSYISLKQKIFLFAVALLVVSVPLFIAMIQRSEQRQPSFQVVVQNGGNAVDVKNPDGTVTTYLLDTSGMFADPSYNIAEGATVYIAAPDPDANPPIYNVIYFQKGEDPTKATTATHVAFKYENRAYVPVDLKPDTPELDTSEIITSSDVTQEPYGGNNPYPQDPYATMPQKPAAKTNTESSSAFWMGGSIYYQGQLCDPLAAKKLDSFSANTLASQPDATGNYPGYFICEDDGKPLRIIKLNGIDGTSAKVYTYPDARDDGTGIILGGNATVADITYYPPVDTTSDKEYQDRQAYADRKAASDKAIAEKEAEKKEAEKRAAEARAKREADKAAAEQAAADEAAKTIAALKKNAYTLSAALLTCENQRFLTFPTWYRGIVDGNCDIQAPTPGESHYLRDKVLAVMLNVVEMILQLVGYASVAFILYGGYKYMISAGSSDGMVSARKTILNAVIGLAISVAAVAIVNTLAGTFLN